MGLKVAVSGKGGVGKSTIAGLIAHRWAQKGLNVLAVDADPVNHLAYVLGLPKERLPRPITEMSDLIEERTGVAPGKSFGKLFKMNPKVDDIPERYAVRCDDGVKLLVLGTIDRASSGCFCPESAILRTLIDHLMLRGQDWLIVDMEAGLEHLGRGSSKGVDCLLIIVEPGQKSLDTAGKIRELADEIGIRRVEAVLNKSNNMEDRGIVATRLSEKHINLIATIPQDNLLAKADLNRIAPISLPSESQAISAISELADHLLETEMK